MILNFNDFINEEKNWIANATKNAGALHKHLHIPEGEKIPVSKINKKIKTLKKKKNKNIEEKRKQNGSRNKTST